MIFAKSRGFIPAGRSFVAGPEWKQYSFELTDFNGIEGYDIMGIFFGGPSKVGGFSLQIDDIRLR